jgi:hypothetical protein
MKSRYIIVLLLAAVLAQNCSVRSDKKTDPGEKKPDRIALRAWNKKYVCSPDDTTKFQLIANREAVGEWETFQVNYLGENKVNLKSYKNKFVCADRNRNGLLVADRDQAYEWELFTIEDLGNNLVALKASNGKYVSADGELQFRLIANRDWAGEWERFTLVKEEK